MMNALLSICIPTFNRSSFLAATIESIVHEDVFLKRNLIEIVVSDNCSTDNTCRVVADFQRLFPGKIIFFQHQDPIDPHFNFEKSLQLGSGRFLKLHNDTLLWRPGMLAEYVSALQQADIHAGLVLTPNGGRAALRGQNELFCRSMNETVDRVSYFLTWIGGFCIRRECFYRLAEPFRSYRLFLPQVDMALRVLADGDGALVDGRVFFENKIIDRRSVYNVAEIFSRNYFSLLQEYVVKGVLDKNVWDAEKKRMLWEYLIPRYFDFFKEFNGAPQSGYWKYTKVYHRNWYFYIAFLYIGMLWGLTRIFPSHDLLRRIKNRMIGRKK